jgi:undecaprenyl-diphosphatase
MYVDAQLFHLLNNLVGQSSLLDSIVVFCASYLAYITGAVFFVLVFFSRYSKREKWELVLVTGIASVIARFGITELIRFFYHHPRPFFALPDVRQLPQVVETSWSFPSGHATFFFAVATAIYLYNKKWGIGFFIAAIVISLGRVVAGVHYPSDIIAGAIIGIVVAYATVYLARKIASKETHQTS